MSQKAWGGMPWFLARPSRLIPARGRLAHGFWVGRVDVEAGDAARLGQAPVGNARRNQGALTRRERDHLAADEEPARFGNRLLVPDSDRLTRADPRDQTPSRRDCRCNRGHNRMPNADEIMAEIVDKAACVAPRARGLHRHETAGGGRRGGARTGFYRVCSDKALG
jgi:hypothetical protein